MVLQFKNLTDLLITFNTEEKCRTYFEKHRWDGGKPVCPHCGHTKAYKLNDGKTYKCANQDCYKKYTATVGTVFENTNISLQKWFCALYLFTAHKKGVSSLQLGRDLGVSQKCAWFMLHRIRELYRDKAPEMLGGTVEIDETYVGGKRTNLHKKKREALKGKGEGYVLMSPVVGMIQRKGTLRLTATGGNKTNQDILEPLIEDNVKRSATVITDGFGGYAGLKFSYRHEVINHAQDEWKRGSFHTNTIEGAFSQLKRGIYGIYHHVSPKHLGRYCDEFAYRYNVRKITDDSKFNLTLQRTEGRLKWKDLIANDYKETHTKSEEKG